MPRQYAFQHLVPKPIVRQYAGMVVPNARYVLVIYARGAPSVSCFVLLVQVFVFVPASKLSSLQTAVVKALKALQERPSMAVVPSGNSVRPCRSPGSWRPNHPP